MPYCPLPDSPHGAGRLYSEEHGAGEPLLFIPGLGGMGSFWAPQLKAFATTHRVIRFDHRGTGQSTHSQIRYSIAQMWCGGFSRILEFLAWNNACAEDFTWR